MTLFKWSRTAASNGSADSTCPFPEGMGAPALNDGARGIMAAVAKYRDDIAGAIVTGGNLNAYTVASFQGFGALTDLDADQIAFSPHVTNGDTVTLNVDGLGAKPLRSAPGVELLAGTLVQGTPYTALYSNVDGAFYLRGYVSSPFNVPFLGGMDFWDTIAPNSGFIFPQGQAISRTVYARAFARWGTQFGVGDGGTTFNVPDKRGRASAMLESAASRLTATYFGGNSTVLGAVGGGESHTLTTAELAPHQHGGSTGNESGQHTHNNPVPASKTTPAAINGGGSAFFWTGDGGNSPTGPELVLHNHAITTDTGTGVTGQPHAIVQPTIVCNYIIRIF